MNERSEQKATDPVASTALLAQVESWLETWGPNCGAPRSVFEGQFRATLRKVFDHIEEKAEANMVKTGKLEGMHYAALKDVRQLLDIPRANASVRPYISKTPRSTRICSYCGGVGYYDSPTLPGKGEFRHCPKCKGTGNPNGKGPKRSWVEDYKSLRNLRANDE